MSEIMKDANATEGNKQRQKKMPTQRRQAIEDHNQGVVEDLTPGDIVKFNRHPYSHWAVYIGKEKLIHLTSITSKEDSKDNGEDKKKNSCSHPGGIIERNRVVSLANNKRLHKANEMDHECSPLDRDTIINRAKSTLGQAPRHLQMNDGNYLRLETCEQFAKWCRYGHVDSGQISQMRYYYDRLATAKVVVIAGTFLVLAMGATRSMFGGN